MVEILTKQGFSVDSPEIFREALPRGHWRSAMGLIQLWIRNHLSSLNQASETHHTTSPHSTPVWRANHSYRGSLWLLVLIITLTGHRISRRNAPWACLWAVILFTLTEAGRLAHCWWHYSLAWELRLREKKKRR